MKKTKFNKKLQLNKETVANLNINGMKNIKGGGPLTDGPCDSTSCCGTGEQCVTVEPGTGLLSGCPVCK